MPAAPSFRDVIHEAGRRDAAIKGMVQRLREAGYVGTARVVER